MSQPTKAESHALSQKRTFARWLNFRLGSAAKQSLARAKLQWAELHQLDPAQTDPLPQLTLDSAVRHAPTEDCMQQEQGRADKTAGERMSERERERREIARSLAKDKAQDEAKRLERERERQEIDLSLAAGDSSSSEIHREVRRLVRAEGMADGLRETGKDNWRETLKERVTGLLQQYQGREAALLANLRARAWVRQLLEELHATADASVDDIVRDLRKDPNQTWQLLMDQYTQREYVKDLFQDLRTGCMLLHLVEACSPLGRALFAGSVDANGRRRLGTRYHRHPQRQIHQLENIQIALSMTKKQGVKLVNIGPRDIYEGKAVPTLGLMWSLILRYQVGCAVPSKAVDVVIAIDAAAVDSSLDSADVGRTVSPPHEVPQGLLEWVSALLKRAPWAPRAPTNLTTAWTDGRVLCALVDAVDREQRPCLPEALPACQQGLTRAFELYGVPQLIEPGDMVSADDKCISTYVSMFRQCVTQWQTKKTTQQAIQVQAVFRGKMARRRATELRIASKRRGQQEEESLQREKAAETEAARRIQAWVRRRQLQKAAKTDAARRIQAWVRRRTLRRHVLQWLFNDKQHKAATRIQVWVRRRTLCRTERLTAERAAKVHASIVLQSFARGNAARAAARARTQALIVLQRAWRRRAERKEAERERRQKEHEERVARAIRQAEEDDERERESEREEARKRSKEEQDAEEERKRVEEERDKETERAERVREERVEEEENEKRIRDEKDEAAAKILRWYEEEQEQKTRKQEEDEIARVRAERGEAAARLERQRVEALRRKRLGLVERFNWQTELARFQDDTFLLDEVAHDGDIGEHRTDKAARHTGTSAVEGEEGPLGSGSDLPANEDNQVNENRWVLGLGGRDVEPGVLAPREAAIGKVTRGRTKIGSARCYFFGCKELAAAGRFFCEAHADKDATIERKPSMLVKVHPQPTLDAGSKVSYHLRVLVLFPRNRAKLPLVRTVEFRFSHLETLYAAMRKEYIKKQVPADATPRTRQWTEALEQWPAFPSKRWVGGAFGGNVKPSFLARRLRDVQTLVGGLCSLPNAIECEELLSFLGLSRDVLGKFHISRTSCPPAKQSTSVFMLAQWS